METAESAVDDGGAAIGPTVVDRGELPIGENGRKERVGSELDDDVMNE